MAHYAILNDTPQTVNGYTVQRVESVIVVDNALEGVDPDPNAQELLVLQWLATFEPTAGRTCKKTSYNANGDGFRKNYAGKNAAYVESLDLFAVIDPAPAEGAVINPETGAWENPA